MKQETARIIDPDSGMTHEYEGIGLSSLVPSLRTALGSEILEIESDNHRTIAIPVSELDPKSSPIIADAVDEKVIGSGVPYDFVAKTRQGRPVLVTKVKRITMEPSAL